MWDQILTLYTTVLFRMLRKEETKFLSTIFRAGEARMMETTETAWKDMDDLANRFFDAIERADIDAVEQAYTQSRR
jgi:hypothetical protein